MGSSRVGITIYDEQHYLQNTYVKLQGAPARRIQQKIYFNVSELVSNVSNEGSEMAVTHTLVTITPKDFSRGGL
jgi:hypothetical protein